MVTIETTGIPKSLFADRYISSRACSTELFNNYDTKSEIFAQYSQVNQVDKLGSHPQMPEENNENSQS